MSTVAGPGDAGPATAVACWSPIELADLLSVSPFTLKNWRRSGKGPHYLRLSDTCIRYPIEDVLSWLVDADARNAGGTL